MENARISMSYAQASGPSFNLWEENVSTGMVRGKIVSATMEGVELGTQQFLKRYPYEGYSSTVRTPMIDKDKDEWVALTQRAASAD